MSHLGDRAAAFVDGQLTPESAERATAHLAACRPCRDLVELERLTKVRLVRPAGPAPSADLVGRLLAMGGPAGPLPPRPGPRARARPRPAPVPVRTAAAAPAWRAGRAPRVDAARPGRPGPRRRPPQPSRRRSWPARCSVVGVGRGRGGCRRCRRRAGAPGRSSRPAAARRGGAVAQLTSVLPGRRHRRLVAPPSTSRPSLPPPRRVR